MEQQQKVSIDGMNPYSHGLRIRNKEDFFPRGFSPEELERVYYRLTAGRLKEYAILESPSFDDVDSYYNPGAYDVDDEFVMEAVVIDKFARTESKMRALSRVLGKYLDKEVGDGERITPQAPVVGKPKKAGTFAYVTVQVPFSDGQTISIVFHSPEGDKKRIGPEDQIIAFRWLLNKRDITHIVAPEDGQEVSLETIGKRMSQLLIKNHAHFVATQKEAVAEQKKLDGLRVQAEALDTENAMLAQNVDKAASEAAGTNYAIASTQAKIEQQKTYNAKLEADIAALQAKKAAIVSGGGKTGLEASVASFEGTLSSMGFSSGGDSQSYKINIVGERHGQPFMETISTNYFVDESSGGRIVVNAAGKTFKAKGEETAVNAFNKAIDALNEALSGKETVAQWISKYQATVDKFNVGDVYKLSRKAFVSQSFEADSYMDGFVVRNVNSGDAGGSMLPAIEFYGEKSNSIINVRYDKLQGYLDAKMLVKEGGSQPATIDPTNPTEYSKIMADPDLQLKYQDMLDSFFQVRFSGVLSGLKGKGWESQGPGLYKDFGGKRYYMVFLPKQVGAGKNLVGFGYKVFIGNEVFLDYVDDLSHDVPYLVQLIDGAAHPDKAEPEPPPRPVAIPADSLPEGWDQGWKSFAEVENNKTYNGPEGTTVSVTTAGENGSLRVLLKDPDKRVIKYEDAPDADGANQKALEFMAYANDWAKNLTEPDATPAIIAPSAEQNGNPAKRTAKILYHHGLQERVMGAEDFIVRIEPKEGPNLIIEKIPNYVFLSHLEKRNGKVAIDQMVSFSLSQDGTLELDSTAIQGPNGIIRGKDQTIAQAFTKSLIDQGLAKSGILKEGRGLVDDEVQPEIESRTQTQTMDGATFIKVVANEYGGGSNQSLQDAIARYNREKEASGSTQRAETYLTGGSDPVGVKITEVMPTPTPEPQPQPEIKPPAEMTMEEILPYVKKVKPFMGNSQLQAMANGLRGEEKAYFKGKFVEMANIIDTMPKTYEQDGNGNDAVVYLHYFKGGSDWYIIEKDMEPEQLQAYGYAILNGDTYNAESGYISIDEITKLGAELDLHWQQKTLGEVKGGKSEPEPEPVMPEPDGNKPDVTKQKPAFVTKLESILSGQYDENLADLEARFDEALTEAEEAGLDGEYSQMIEQVSDYYTAKLSEKAKEVK